MTTTSTTTDDKHLTPDEEFEAHIAAHPRDLTARGAYADYLDERGDPRAADHRLYLALQDVLASPHDDAPRLAWAAVAERYAGAVRCERCWGEGWSSDAGIHDCPACDGTGSVPNGLGERAELVRAQVKIARHPAHRLNPDATYGEYAEVRARGRELFTAMVHAGRGSFGLPPQVVVTIDAINGDLPPDAGLSFPVAFVRRGFVDEIRCDLRTFAGGECGRCQDQPGWAFVGNRLRRCPACKGDTRTPGIAEAAFRAHPVTRVVLTDREPHRGHSSFGWDFHMAGLPDRPGDLPVELWRLLLPYRPDEQIDKHGWYDTRQAAIDALSRAACNYGRGLAGLGPLPSGQPGGGS